MRHSIGWWAALIGSAVGLTSLAALLANVAHELGHALVGHLAGLYVSLLRMGAGRLLWERYWGRTKLEIRLPTLFNPGGLTLAYLQGPSFPRWRLAAWLLGGSLMNLALSAPAWVILTSMHRADIRMHMIVFAALAGWAGMNGFLAVATLFPHRIGKSRLMSDGLQLLKMPFVADNKLRENFIAGRISLATWSWQQGDLEEARRFLELARSVSPDQPSVIYLLANIDVASARFEEAARLLRAFRLRESGVAHRAAALSDLAGIDLHLGSSELLDEALQCAREAVESEPGNPLFRIIYGVALVHAGKGADGERLLRDTSLPNPQTKATAFYLCLRARAWTLLGESKNAAEDQQLAQRLDPRCPFLRTPKQPIENAAT